MIRPAALALLTAMAAAPASAQIASGACQAHRADEVRCAVSVELPNNRTPYAVAINAIQMGPEARITTDTYVSTCGSPGRMIGRSNIANSGRSTVGAFSNRRDEAGQAAQIIAGFCVETFLLNCTIGGQRANCQQVINMGASRIEIR